MSDLSFRRYTCLNVKTCNLPANLFNRLSSLLHRMLYLSFVVAFLHCPLITAVFLTQQASTFCLAAPKYQDHFPWFDRATS